MLAADCQPNADAAEGDDRREQQVAGLTFGIPSNPVMALMIGALIIQGITPGPNVASDEPALLWGMIVSMCVFAMALFGLIGCILIKLDFESAPLLLGSVLGPMDENLRRRPGDELAAHLRRHPVKAEVRLVPSGGASITDVLLAQVRDEAADRLVMGGYGHSRLREMLVGGTTRSILKHMTVPVLFAH